jgi:hypothetical protein
LDQQAGAWRYVEGVKPHDVTFKQKEDSSAPMAQSYRLDTAEGK